MQSDDSVPEYTQIRGRRLELHGVELIHNGSVGANVRVFVKQFDGTRRGQQHHNSGVHAAPVPATRRKMFGSWPVARPVNNGMLRHYPGSANPPRAAGQVLRAIDVKEVHLAYDLVE